MEDDLQALRRAVDEGSMTAGELRARLETLVEAEYARPEPDAGRIRACEALLRELHGAEAAPSVADRCREAIRQEGRGRKRPRWVAWAAAAAAVVLAAISLHAVNLRWVTSHPSADGNQYVLEGHVVTIDMIERAQAAHDGTQQTLTTEDPAAMEAFLGFMPTLPRPEIFGATRVLYAANILPGESTDLAVLYEDAVGEGQAVYSVIWFQDTELFYVSVEQSASGVTVEVDGVSVYCTDNLARRTYVWTEGQVYHCLSGYLDDATAFGIIGEIMN